MPVDVTDEYVWVSVRDAALFVQNSFRQIKLSDEQGIGARIGKLKSDPEGGTIVQAYYFEKGKWSTDEAKKWVSDHKKAGSSGMQRRYIESASRMSFDDPKAPKIIGHAAVFNKRVKIYGDAWEEIAPGAFSEAIRSEDIYALWNHEASNVLGNTGAETLRLAEDEVGLHYEIIPPDTTLGRDLVTLIKRGDVRKSSFGFNIEDERITKLEGKGVLRTILKVKPLFDVSPVTFPAYPQTDVHVRMIAGSNETAYLFEDSDQLIWSDPPKDESADGISIDQFTRRIDDLRRKVGG